MTRFKAIQLHSAMTVEIQNHGHIQTLKIDPEIIRVEDLEFTDCAGGVIQRAETRIDKQR